MVNAGENTPPIPPQLIYDDSRVPFKRPTGAAAFRNDENGANGVSVTENWWGHESGPSGNGSDSSGDRGEVVDGEGVGNGDRLEIEPEAGEYHVELTVTTDAGERASASETLVVGDSGITSRRG
ncbi:hypothetical protein AB7C87_21295 [Natrarchaeobius sp. A-rgal3]|uniref:hypothetical protein n=1 Tax=Natrarchaeobius versutus TaxID=1679078 RepID=UPI003510A4DC